MLRSAYGELRIRLLAPAAVVVVLFALALPGWSQTQYYEAQPAGKHSTLIDINGKSIRDDVFATAIKNTVFKGMPRQANVRNATFLFQQCYGGGFLDDLKGVFNLTPAIPMVGGSACKHNQVAYGQMTSAEAGGARANGFTIVPAPGGFWTNALCPELNKCNQALFTDAVNARALDAVGVNSRYKWETGQAIFMNSGQSFTLKDPGAGSHHAVLWGGLPTALRYYGNIGRVRQALMNCWNYLGAPPNSISILFTENSRTLHGLYDDQPLPGDWNPSLSLSTTDNLWLKLGNLAANTLNSTETFFFYATDHGGVVTDLVVNPGNVIDPGGVGTAPYEAQLGEVQGMYLETHNTPTVTCGYTGQIEPGTVMVSFNGTLLGPLMPGPPEMELPVPEELIAYPNNEIQIMNFGITPVEITKLEFFTGAIGPDPTLTPEGAKTCPDGTRVGPTGMVVTATFGNSFYAESPSRECGIRVDKVGHGRSRGDLVDILGVAATDPANDERYIQATLVSSTQGTELAPVGVNNKSVGGGDLEWDPVLHVGQRGMTGGSGLNNTGLLVTTWGKFIKTGNTTFTLDDGSGTIVKCVVVTAQDMPNPLPTYAVATGVSSCEKDGDNLIRLLRVRHANDIVPCK